MADTYDCMVLNAFPSRERCAMKLIMSCSVADQHVVPLIDKINFWKCASPVWCVLCVLGDILHWSRRAASTLSTVSFEEDMEVPGWGSCLSKGVQSAANF